MAFNLTAWRHTHIAAQLALKEQCVQPPVGSMLLVGTVSSFVSPPPSVLVWSQQSAKQAHNMLPGFKPQKRKSEDTAFLFVKS